MNSLKRRKWKYYLSVFCMMEVLDLRQENYFLIKKIKQGISGKRALNDRRERNLSSNELKKLGQKFVENVLKPHKMDYGFFILEEGWVKALEITRETNITSFDAIHLSTAIGSDCDILITSDGHFIKEGNKYIQEVMKGKLVLCEPENINKILIEKGYTKINLK